jgi:hypothetical protein
MFIALMIKEWREKALVFLFELAVLAALLGAASFFREKRDVQEWLVYAVLLLFFPFAALVLGAAGFEAEHRQGAWAYLFSRPLGRTRIWLAKFAALLSFLAALWLVFLAAWEIFPAIREMAAAPRFLMNYEAGSGFPWWSLGLSAFFLTVAFSLSPLHERQFNILFVAVAAGLVFPAAARLALFSRTGGFLGWIAPTRAQTALALSLTLVALSFAAASILTLIRSDFSQPKRQAAGFARRFAPFLLASVAATAAWIWLTPGTGDRYLFSGGKVGGAPSYVADQGIFKYSEPKDRIQWLAKTKHARYFRAAASPGGIAYTAFAIESRIDVREELWVADGDGRNRRRVLGRGPGLSEWPGEAPMADLLLAPDGSKIAILSSNVYGRSGTARKRPPLWIVNADGTGLENLPDDPVLFGQPSDRHLFWLMAWAEEGRSLLLIKRTFDDRAEFGLWIYDLAARRGRLLLDDAVPASWISGDDQAGQFVILKRPGDKGAPWRLSLLDLRTLAVTDIPGITDMGHETRYISPIVWDQSGDRFAYLSERKQPGGASAFWLVVYSRTAGRIVAQRSMTAKEPAALLLQPAWLADGRRLVVLDRDARGLKVLGPDLSEAGAIAFPRGLDDPASLSAVGNVALVEDNRTDMLWRLDLGTKRWKRLY